jgi:hypothetical protein
MNDTNPTGRPPLPNLLERPDEGRRGSSKLENLKARVEALTSQVQEVSPRGQNSTSEVQIDADPDATVDLAQQCQTLAQRVEDQVRQLEELKQELKRKEFKIQSLNWRLRESVRREQELVKFEEAFREAQAISLTGSFRLLRALSAPLRFVRRLPHSRPAISRRLSGLLKTSQQTGEYGTDLISRQPALPPLSESDINSILLIFDAEWYLLKNEDVARGGFNPLDHYIRSGALEGRSPHPLFDPKFYLKTYPEAAITGRNPFLHYVTEGWKRGFKPHPQFDPSFYRFAYPDIAEAGVEPLTHFIRTGVHEGRGTCQDEGIQLESFEAEFEIPREPLTDAAPFESDIKAIALYLPQFHAIPENDEWWGTGFTEWTNVRRGKAHFPSHYQPHVPAGLDYYDLSERQVLERQIKLAQDSGIYGFCFYYYWFAGKILLDLPIRRMLERDGTDFPFCICWANENWTRRWDGREQEILIAQQHSAADDVAFLKNLEPILFHKNYIRVKGKPLLIVYQPSILPDARETAARWRNAFRVHGHGEIFLAAMQTFSDRSSPTEYGFDGVIQFPPHIVSPPINGLVEGLDCSFRGQVYDYNRTKWSFIQELHELSSTQNMYPGVMPSWDNTARRQSKSSVWINSSPESYYDWLEQVATFLRANRVDEDRFVFINAWNEWAEGCHLEPDQRFGHAWLNATRLALQSETSSS